MVVGVGDPIALTVRIGISFVANVCTLSKSWAGVGLVWWHAASVDSEDALGNSLSALE